MRQLQLSAHGLQRAAAAEGRNEARSGNRLEAPPVTAGTVRVVQSAAVRIPFTAKCCLVFPCLRDLEFLDVAALLQRGSASQAGISSVWDFGSGHGSVRLCAAVPLGWSAPTAAAAAQLLRGAANAVAAVRAPAGFL